MNNTRQFMLNLAVNHINPFNYPWVTITCKLKQGMNYMAIPNKPTQHIVRYVQWCVSIIPLIKISFPFQKGLTCSQIHGMSLNSFEQFLRHFCSRDWLGQETKPRIRISTWPYVIKTVKNNPNRTITLFHNTFLLSYI